VSDAWAGAATASSRTELDLDTAAGRVLHGVDPNTLPSRAPAHPPTPDACLVHSRRKRYRGGTVIAVDVHDVAEHQRRLCRAGGYRPPACPRCGADRLHVHDHLQRVLPGSSRVPCIDIVRYICADANCAATWRVIPAFVARHLWRHWETVARVIAGDPPRAGDPPVPSRTRRRWKARLRSAARQVVSVLVEHDAERLAAFIPVPDFDWTRQHLVQFLLAGRVLGRHGLADIASAMHVVEPGVRLM